jgi:phage gpG-like protein
MAAMITVQVVGVEAVQANLASMSAVVHQRLLRAVERSTAEVQQLVAGRYLTGGALNVRSGRLRRSITMDVEDSGQAITGRVGTNVDYGRFWELGFHGSVTVHSHTRSVAFGRSVAPFTVPTHTRRVDQDAHPFLGPALQELAPSIHDRLARAAVGDENGR